MSEEVVQQTDSNDSTLKPVETTERDFADAKVRANRHLPDTPAPKPEKKGFAGWLKRNFVRQPDQDNVPNSKAYTLEPPHPKYKS